MTRRRFEVLLILFSCLGQLTASNEIQGGGCIYYYIRQPLYDLNCNPWSLVTNANTLPLYCHIQAPKNDHLPNIEWFKRSANETVRVYPGGLNSLKYSNPVSSRDGTDFKFVNFSLEIHDVSDNDVGCYYCEINVATENDCSFDIRPSTRFCLMEEDAYSGLVACVSVPVNDDRVCAANETCVPALNGTVQTTPDDDMSSFIEPTSLLYSTESDIIASTRELSSSINLVTQSLVDNSIETQSLTKERSLSLVGTEPSESLSLTNSMSPSAESTLLQFSMISSSSPSAQDKASSQVLTSSRVSKVTVRTTKPPPSQQRLRIGLYVGVGVCCLLLVVILVLLAAVAVLCKAPGVRRRRKEAVLPGSVSPEPLNNTVWNRPPSSTSTFLVNEGSVHLLPPTHSRRSTLPAGGASDSGWMGGPGHRGSLPGVLPSMKREKPDQGAHMHHRLSLINQLQDDGHVTTQEATHPHSRSGSPDSHYYHVLEQPRYYNFNWLASDPEGRELLLQNWKEGDTKATGQQSPNSKQKSTGQSAGHEAQLQGMGDERESYHWKVAPPPLLKGKKAEGGSPRRQKRQLYTRLDCRKMEPRREYTRVSVKKTSNSVELEREE